LHGDAFVKTHGIEKALYTPRLRELVESGIPLSLTTDAFRVSPANPWLGISWAVTGKSVSNSMVLAKDNRLSREEALKLYTLGAAWFENLENEKGRITPGNVADFILLNKDYFTVEDDEIKSIYSVLEVVNGSVVFVIHESAQLVPTLPAPLPDWSPVKHFGGYYWGD